MLYLLFFENHLAMQKVWKTVKRHEGEEEKDLVQELEDKFDELEADLWRSDPYEWSSEWGYHAPWSGCMNHDLSRPTIGLHDLSPRVKDLHDLLLNLSAV